MSVTWQVCSEESLHLAMFPAHYWRDAFFSLPKALSFAQRQGRKERRAKKNLACSAKKKKKKKLMIALHPIEGNQMSNLAHIC